jgi:A/G-specific adenine glycosylase
MLYDDLHRLTQNTSVQNVGARTWYYALMDYGAHLKASKISHNEKSAHYTKQSPYHGSVRQLRAKVLFAITHKEKLPDDERVNDVLEQLSKEGYIVRKGRRYAVA